MTEAFTYRISWLDRWTAWIERLPGPPWGFYVGLLAGSILINNAIRWLDGSLSAGAFDVARVVEVPLLLFYLPFTHYLTTTARNAMRDFRPLLEVDDKTFQQMTLELSALPRRSGRFAIALGIPFGLLIVVADPTTWAIRPDSPPLTIAAVLVIASLMFSFFMTFVFHCVHQLRMVDRIQRMPSSISLHQTTPVYAFSFLTARTGIGILLLLYYYLFIYYSLQIYGPPAPLSAGSFLIIGIMLLVALASFVVPLNGMHGRLVAAKRKALSEANLRMEMTISRLHDQVDRESYDKAEGLRDILQGLAIEREAVSGVSTWPWSPETFRGFVTAMVLPILIWLITTWLGRILPG